eukprot:GFYU01005010.1.p1 GENE.GFYU01005010.1~~GFYU01005010.1.p1  ORF type:complete len:789 (+),score=315.66 GFYU01005010.1:158-2524(+)
MAPVKFKEKIPDVEFRAQVDKLIKKLKGTGKKYEDPDFRADSSSLFHDANKPTPGHIPEDYIKWLRPSDMDPVDDPQLFVEGTSAGDVIQGGLGDCWFLGALAVVANRPELIEAIFPPSYRQPDLGFYVVRFYKDTDWREILIDDRIPCTPQGKPIYASSKDPNELWVMLIEKAYAKLHTSYQALIGGLVDFGLRDLTGGAPQQILLDKEVKDKDVFWKSVKEYHREKCLMGISFSSSGPAEAAAAHGILRGHAYSVLDLKEPKGYKHEDGTQLRLFKIRNPWGKREWTGDYSDNSDLMDDKLMKEIGAQGDANDGTFWMAIQDVLTNFNKLYICRMFPEEEWISDANIGEWTEATAGGVPGRGNTWMKNQQFKITLKKKCNALVVLTQPDMRIVKGPSWNKYDNSIGFFVFKGGATDTKVTGLTKQNYVGKTASYFPHREVSLDLKDVQGTFFVIPTTFKAGSLGDFFVSVYAECRDGEMILEGGEDFDPDGDEWKAAACTMDVEADEQQAPEHDEDEMDQDTGATALSKMVAQLSHELAESQKNYKSLMSKYEKMESSQQLLINNQKKLMKDIEGLVSGGVLKAGGSGGTSTSRNPSRALSSTAPARPTTAPPSRARAKTPLKTADTKDLNQRAGLYRKRCLYYFSNDTDKPRRENREVLKMFQDAPDPATHFNFGRAYVGDHCFRPVADVLATQKKLAQLQLAGNNISDDAIEALVEALKDNNKLQVLDVSNNPITFVGGNALLKLLDANPRLTDLDISRTKIERNTREKIMKKIDANRLAWGAK